MRSAQSTPHSTVNQKTKNNKNQLIFDWVISKIKNYIFSVHSVCEAMNDMNDTPQLHKTYPGIAPGG